MGGYIKNRPHWTLLSIDAYQNLPAAQYTVAFMGNDPEGIQKFLGTIQTGERLCIAFLYTHAVRNACERNFAELYICDDYPPLKALADFSKAVSTNRKGVTVEIIEYRIVECVEERS